MDFRFSTFSTRPPLFLMKNNASVSHCFVKEGRVRRGAFDIIREVSLSSWRGISMGTILKPAHLPSAGCLELLLETTSPVFFLKEITPLCHMSPMQQGPKSLNSPPGPSCGHFNTLTAAQTFIRNSELKHNNFTFLSLLASNTAATSEQMLLMKIKSFYFVRDWTERRGDMRVWPLALRLMFETDRTRLNASWLLGRVALCVEINRIWIFFIHTMVSNYKQAKFVE